VTRFAYKKSGFSTGWGVSALLNKVNPNAGAANEVAGDVKMSKATFSGRLDVRLIDVKTGEILAVAKEDGTVKDVSCKVAGTGSDVQYDQEMVNKIFEPITDKIAETLIKKIADIRAQADN
jgi:curli biogenesis system outer membrane secretion channel CsgG